MIPLTYPPHVFTAATIIRLILVNGFLGAGKTTALSALAAHLRRLGLRPAIITNDQAANLVDTAVLRSRRIPVSEVAGGCFCCRFSDLLETVQEALHSDPDIILCEAVGSCTDLAATVIRPLAHFYPDTFRIAPFAVLADPDRVGEALISPGTGGLAPEARYIFDKQLEEADQIVLTKSDTLSADEIARLAEYLAERYRKPVHRISAVHGDGITAWASSLLSETRSGLHPLQEIDYDIYARGEAVLGWLNAAVDITAASPFDPTPFLQTLFGAIQDACRAGGLSVAHVKASLSAPGCFARANLTELTGAPSIAVTRTRQITHAALIINARVQSGPEQLREVVESALRTAATAAGITATVKELACFSPSYPDPPYPMREMAA